MMGANPKHCRQLAQLIGIKTFTNEFIAYQRLGIMLDNTKIHSNYTQFHGIANLTQGHPKYDAAVNFWYDDIIHVHDNSRRLEHGILDVSRISKDEYRISAVRFYHSPRKKASKGRVFCATPQSSLYHVWNPNTKKITVRYFYVFFAGSPVASFIP
jgi:hypothetical protein